MILICLNSLTYTSFYSKLRRHAIRRKQTSRNLLVLTEWMKGWLKEHCYSCDSTNDWQNLWSTDSEAAASQHPLYDATLKSRSKSLAQSKCILTFFYKSRGPRMRLSFVDINLSVMTPRNSVANGNPINIEHTYRFPTCPHSRFTCPLSGFTCPTLESYALAYFEEVSFKLIIII